MSPFRLLAISIFAMLLPAQRAALIHQNLRVSGLYYKLDIERALTKKN